MGAAGSRHIVRPRRLNSYLAYSIGCFIVWAVVWVIVLLRGSKEPVGTILLIFLGWIIGWTSATIARFVYPPPKRWRVAGPTSKSEE